MAFTDLLLGAFVALLATSIGSLIVLPFRCSNGKVYSMLLSFAAGIMAFSAAEMFFQSHKAAGDVAAITGFVLGVAALVVFEKTLPHIHFLLRKKELAHPKKKVALIAGTITLHNIPEGVAIAAAFASSTPLGWLVTSAIALQDIPEGLMISAPLACYGMDLKTSIKFGVFSGVVEFLAAIVGYALLVVAQAVIPAALAFSAGAMAYVVFVELLPDAFAKKEESLVAVSFFGGIIMAFVIAALLGF